VGGKTAAKTAVREKEWQAERPQEDTSSVFQLTGRQIGSRLNGPSRKISMSNVGLPASDELQ
jgi:hypothetical protein